MEPPKQAVFRAYELARELTPDTNNQSWFLIGLRIGVCMALWRPGLAHTFLFNFKKHLVNNSMLTHNEMTSLEDHCISTIYHGPMIDLPSPQEEN